MTQLTFTEDEVKKTAEFVQFVYDHGRFDVDTKGALKLTRCLTHMNNVIKKMDDHIMELKKVTLPTPTNINKPTKKKGK